MKALALSVQLDDRTSCPNVVQSCPNRHYRANRTDIPFLRDVRCPVSRVQAKFSRTSCPVTS